MKIERNYLYLNKLQAKNGKELCVVRSMCVCEWVSACIIRDNSKIDDSVQCASTLNDEKSPGIKCSICEVFVLDAYKKNVKSIFGKRNCIKKLRRLCVCVRVWVCIPNSNDRHTDECIALHFRCGRWSEKCLPNAIIDFGRCVEECHLSNEKVKTISSRSQNQRKREGRPERGRERGGEREWGGESAFANEHVQT